MRRKSSRLGPNHLKESGATESPSLSSGSTKAPPTPSLRTHQWISLSRQNGRASGRPGQAHIESLISHPHRRRKRGSRRGKLKSIQPLSRSGPFTLMMQLGMQRGHLLRGCIKLSQCKRRCKAAWPWRMTGLVSHRRRSSKQKKCQGRRPTKCRNNFVRNESHRWNGSQIPIRIHGGSRRKTIQTVGATIQLRLTKLPGNRPRK